MSLVGHLWALSRTSEWGWTCLSDEKVVTQRRPPLLHPGGHWKGAADRACPRPGTLECSLKDRMGVYPGVWDKRKEMKWNAYRQSLPWLFLVHRSSVLIRIFPKIRRETLYQGSEHKSIHYVIESLGGSVDLSMLIKRWLFRKAFYYTVSAVHSMYTVRSICIFCMHRIKSTIFAKMCSKQSTLKGTRYPTMHCAWLNLPFISNIKQVIFNSLLFFFDSLLIWLLNIETLVHKID